MEVIVTDPITGGKKGSKSERFDLVPVYPQMELARVYGYGIEKYGDRNWEKGYRWGLALAAMIRHILRFWRGESIDPETGCHHLAHAAWHCFTLMTFEKRQIGEDDRVFEEE